MKFNCYAFIGNYSLMCTYYSKISSTDRRTGKAHELQRFADLPPCVDA